MTSWAGPSLYLCYDEHEDPSSCNTTVYLSGHMGLLTVPFLPGVDSADVTITDINPPLSTTHSHVL